MKINLPNGLNIWMLCLMLVLSACNAPVVVEPNPEPDPNPTPTPSLTITIKTPHNPTNGGAMKVGYYLFNKDGEAIQYVDKNGSNTTLRWTDATLSKESPVVLTVTEGVPAEGSIVVMASSEFSDKEFALNANVSNLQDQMITYGSEINGECFSGRATFGQEKNTELTLQQLTGRVSIVFSGTQEVLDGVISAEVVLNGDSFCGGMLADGTPKVSGRDGTLVLKSDATWIHAIPTVKQPCAEGVVKVYYHLAGETQQHMTEVPLEARHNFTVKANYHTKITAKLELCTNKMTIPSFALTTDWVEGSDGTTDDSDGNKDAYYHKFIKEKSFSVTTPTAPMGTEIAVYGDYFYFPTGSGNNLNLAIWSISQGKEVGRISTPKPGESSFCSTISSLYISNDKLFVGHGAYSNSITRVDIFDLKNDPTKPVFITSIGGLPSLPPAYGANTPGCIGEPVATYEKDGKVFVLDGCRLNVFNSSDVTADKSGVIQQTAVLDNVLLGSIGHSFVSYKNDLYVTNNKNETGAKGLVKVNWAAVDAGVGANLLDPNAKLLQDYTIAKIFAFDNHYFVIDKDEMMNSFDKDLNFLGNCNNVYDENTKRNSIIKIVNATPLPVQADGKQRILVCDEIKSAKCNMMVIRVEKKCFTEF